MTFSPEMSGKIVNSRVLFATVAVSEFLVVCL